MLNTAISRLSGAASNAAAQFFCMRGGCPTERGGWACSRRGCKGRRHTAESSWTGFGEYWVKLVRRRGGDRIEGKGSLSKVPFSGIGSSKGQSIVRDSRRSGCSCVWGLTWVADRYRSSAIAVELSSLRLSVTMAWFSYRDLDFDASKSENSDHSRNIPTR